MGSSKFRPFYQSEKFGSARRSLMLPHPSGEAESLMHAFMNIEHAMHQFDRSLLDDDATRWMRTLDRYMGVTGVVADPERGAWITKAETFSADDKIEIARAVDELAYWFESRLHD